MPVETTIIPSGFNVITDKDERHPALGDVRVSKIMAVDGASGAIFFLLMPHESLIEMAQAVMEGESGLVVPPKPQLLVP